MSLDHFLGGPKFYNWPHYVRTVRTFQHYEREAVAELARASTPEQAAEGRRHVAYIREPTRQVVCEFLADVLAYTFSSEPVTYEA